MYAEGLVIGTAIRKSLGAACCDHGKAGRLAGARAR
jgi:hypothetical protein